MQKQKDLNLASIKSDHGGEFQNVDLDNYYIEHRIEYTFSVPRTSRQNGLVEHKNRWLEEPVRMMLNGIILHN